MTNERALHYDSLLTRQPEHGTVVSKLIRLVS